MIMMILFVYLLKVMMIIMMINDDDDEGGPEDVQHAQVPAVRQASRPAHPPHRPLRVGPLGKL